MHRRLTSVEYLWADANLSFFLGVCQSLLMVKRGRPPLVGDDVILTRALDAFATQGYPAMSVRALNAELGLSHETVSQRFGPKGELFRAAVAHGVSLFIADFDEGIITSAPADDLGHLRATVRAFMVASSRHPALGDLLHHASITLEQRLELMAETGFAERVLGMLSLLNGLHDADIIRQTTLRELWFLAQGAVAPLHFPELSAMFDPFDGPLDPDALIDRMCDAVMRSMLR